MNALTRWNPFGRPEELEGWGPMARWNPWKEFDQMQKQMDQWFGGKPLWPSMAREAMTLAEWAPAVDITEDDKEFLIKAELPDVKKEDVKVTVEEGVLTIRGERKAEKEEKGKRFHRIERAFGSFLRSFALPQGAEADKITSEFKDGVLVVHLPKNPAAKAKATEIKIG